jgi:kynurenine formamidase
MTFKWIFLSHPWGPSNPSYGNGERVKIKQIKDMSCGDSCNTMEFTANNHNGTHFDFPKHFDPQGFSCTDLDADSFIHSQIATFWFEFEFGEILTPNHLNAQLSTQNRDASLILVRTGAAKFRQSEEFWKNGPGIGTGVAEFLRMNFPKITTFGVDAISISSFTNRELGRLVHREFLCHSAHPIFVIEDLQLEDLRKFTPIECYALPLRIENSDGAPCTVIAKVR